LPLPCPVLSASPPSPRRPSRHTCPPSPPRSLFFFFLMLRPPPISTLFPYTTLFRSHLRRDLRLDHPARPRARAAIDDRAILVLRSEEHTSELQSLTNLVCRLLLEKKKKKHNTTSANKSRSRQQNPYSTCDAQSRLTT